MSGGSAKKPKPVAISQGEKIQTQLAKDQIAYYRSTYAPLESEFRDEASRDYSSRFAGQNATASTRQLTPALAETAMSGTMADAGSIGSAITSGRVSGMAQGRRERDDGAMDALGVGLGVTADAGKSLSEAGRIQTGAAIDHTQEQIAKMRAKSDVRNAAIGAVASVATAYGTQKFMAAKDLKEHKKLVQDKADTSATLQTRAINKGTAYEHPSLRGPLMGRR